MKLLFLAIFVFSGPFALATDFISCTREADGYSYNIKGTLETDWVKVASDDHRADGKLNVLRTGNSKAVRNYDAEFHMHKKAKTIWVSLSKRMTTYGDLHIAYRGKKITKAVLNLNDGRELELNCEFVE